MPYPIEEQACSTWALSGDESRATSIHNEFIALTDPFSLMNPEQRRQQLGNTLQAQRQEVMNRIAALRDETEYAVPNMYLCGCYNNRDDIVPSHYWIEDRTNNVTTDTFINRDSVVFINRVGVDGANFQPGCEGHSIPANEIVRVQVSGYTKGQIDILSNYTRPDNVVQAVIQAKIQDRDSDIRVRDEHQARLNNNNIPAHRTRAYFQGEVNKYNGYIAQKSAQIVNLQNNPPARPALPENEGGNLRFNVTEVNYPLYQAMQEAREAREAREAAANADVNADVNADANVDVNVDANVDANVDVNADANADVNEQEQPRNIGQRVYDSIYQNRVQIVASAASALALYGLYRVSNSNSNSNSNTQTIEPPSSNPKP